MKRRRRAPVFILIAILLSGFIVGGFLLMNKKSENVTFEKIPANFVVISGTPYYRIEISKERISYSRCDEKYKYFRANDICGNISPTKSMSVNESEITQFYNNLIKNSFDKLPESFTKSEYGTWLIIIVNAQGKKMLVKSGLSAEVNEKVLNFAEEKLDMRCGLRPC